MSKTLLLVVGAVVVFFLLKKQAPSTYHGAANPGGGASVGPGSTGATGQNTGDPIVGTVITTVGNLVASIYRDTFGGTSTPYNPDAVGSYPIGYDDNGLPIYSGTGY